MARVSTTIYERMLLIAEREHLWHSPTSIVDEFTELGIREVTTSRRDSVFTVKNQIRFLGQVKAIFDKNKQKKRERCLNPNSP